MQFKEIINNCVLFNNELKNNNKILIINEDLNEFVFFNEQDKLIEIDYIKKHFNIILIEYFSHYILPIGIHICWHYDINGINFTGGEFKLKRSFTMLIDFSKSSNSKKLSTFEKKLYKDGYRFFGSHPHAGDGFFTAIQIDKNTITDNVWLVDIIHENIKLMEIDYPQYIEHTIKLKGLYDWQYLFMSGDLNNLDFDVTPFRQRLENFPKLFPGSDVIQYLKLYYKKGGK